MQYRKIVKGWLEIVYDMESGEVVESVFVPNDSEQIERRMVREEAPQSEGELEDNELIEHPDDIALLESKEKFYAMDMVQPAKLEKKQKTGKKKV